MEFIKKEIVSGNSPSVREVTKALGLRSSRSGLRVINRLIELQWLKRDKFGKLDI